MLNTNRSDNNYQKNSGINTNFSIPVIVKTNLLSWRVKDQVLRKRLEYINVDEPRVTTLVQYPPGITFNKCSHDRGEEILVLSGDFANDKDIYSAGSYIRNPPNTRVTSATVHGCTLLFKTGQFQRMDSTKIIVHPYDYNNSWISVGEPGVYRVELHKFLDESIYLYKVRPQCWITFKQKIQSIEVLVCEGIVSVDGVVYATGTWFRYPPHSRIKIVAVSNTCLFVKKIKGMGGGSYDAY